MADPMSRFNQGARIAQNFRGGNVGSGVQSTIISSRLRANAAIHKEAVGSGMGWTKDGNGDPKPPSYVSGAEEEAISWAANKKGLLDSDKKRLEILKLEMTIQNKYAEDEAKRVDKFYKTDPKQGAAMMKESNRVLKERIGPKLYNIVNPGDRNVEEWTKGTSYVNLHQEQTSRAYDGAVSLYIENPNDENLLSMEQNFYSLADKEGRRTPTQNMTAHPTPRMMEQRKKEKAQDAKVKRNLNKKEMPPPKTADEALKRKFLTIRSKKEFDEKFNWAEKKRISKLNDPAVIQLLGSMGEESFGEENLGESLRNDGTKKGTGFLGIKKGYDGSDRTEISIGVDFGEGEVEIPTLVPTLTKSEIDFLLKMDLSKGAGQIPNSIKQKAIQHAKQRISKGLSPFKEGEKKPWENYK